MAARRGGNSRRPAPGRVSSAHRPPPFAVRYLEKDSDPVKLICAPFQYIQLSGGRQARAALGPCSAPRRPPASPSAPGATATPTALAARMRTVWAVVSGWSRAQVQVKWLLTVFFLFLRFVCYFLFLFQRTGRAATVCCTRCSVPSPPRGRRRRAKCVVSRTNAS